jgi:hypothetical protein
VKVVTIGKIEKLQDPGFKYPSSKLGSSGGTPASSSGIERSLRSPSLKGGEVHARYGCADRIVLRGPGSKAAFLKSAADFNPHCYDEVRFF